MKKIIIAFLAILYMGLSSGIAMEIHYCMGKKAGIDFYGEIKDKCGKCGMKGKAGCCHDEHKFLKLNDTYKNVSNETVFGVPDAVILHSYKEYRPDFSADAATRVVQNHSPPDYTRPSACIMNCVFRL